MAVLDNNPIPPQPTKIPSDYKVCLYYSSWGIYERNFYLPAIDFSRVTHLIYAFGNIAPDPQHPEPNGKTLKIGSVYMPDLNDVRVGFDALNDIRKKYPHLKTILSIGGWTYSVNFSAMANDPAQRTQFVDTAAALMTENNFDGIDIDWEIPVEGGNGIQHLPADKQNFTTLLKAIRTKIGTDKLLTIAGPARPQFHNNLEVDKIAEIVDWVNLMAYDYHGPWMSATTTAAEKMVDENAVTNFNAPLYPDYTAPIPKGKTHDLNIDASVRSLLTLELPPQKLVLGLSFYGRAFSAVEPGPNNDGLYQSYDGHPHGTWPDEKGAASGVYEFWDLHDNFIGKPGWQEFYNHQAGAAWLYNKDEKVFIGYDNEQTIWNKCAYLASMNLGGAMMWEACNDRYNQLLYVVNNALNEGGIKSTGQLVPSKPHDQTTSGEALVSWDDDDLSKNGTVPLSKITVAKSSSGIIGFKTTYGDVDSEWRGSGKGIRTEVNIPSERYIDRIDFYLGDGTDETFAGLGLHIDNRTYVSLGNTKQVDNMVSIGSESARVTHMSGTLQNGKIHQVTGNYNHRKRWKFRPFNPLEKFTDDEFKGTAYEYEMKGGFAYAGQLKGTVNEEGIDAHLNIAGVETPHLTIVAGSMDFADKVSVDGGFSYSLGLQFKPLNGSFKIGNPNDPAITVEYFGPTLGFMNQVGYQNGNLSIKVSNPLGKVDFETGSDGITCDCTLITGFSERFEIDSKHIKIGFGGDGIEINSQRFGVYFGYGPFCIHVTLIDFHAIDQAINDFINVGKKIWNFSFKTYMKYKKFVVGVVDAVSKFMKTLFG